MNRSGTIPLALAGSALIAFSALAHAQQASFQSEVKQTVVSNEQEAVLDALVREQLLLPDYGLEIRHERDPYRWRSTGKFAGITFFLKGDEAFDKREGKKRPHVYITFMPKDYDGKPMDSLEDQGKIQVMMFPAKLLGFRGDLRVYACRDFGYGLPKNGPLRAENIRKVLGIQERTKESSQQPAAR